MTDREFVAIAVALFVFVFFSIPVFLLRMEKKSLPALKAIASSIGTAAVFGLLIWSGQS